MSEATGGSGEIKQVLIERSLQDESFRRRLLEDPKGDLEAVAGRNAWINIQTWTSGEDLCCHPEGAPGS